jgi:hypothetical protein
MSNDLLDRINDQLAEIDALVLDDLLPPLEPDDITHEVLAKRWDISKKSAKNRMDKLVAQCKVKCIFKRGPNGSKISTYKTV